LRPTALPHAETDPSAGAPTGVPAGSPTGVTERNDAGFTLTEMAASLLVTAMLVSGLGEITRQFARTIVRINTDLQMTRVSRIAGASFLALERAEPGGISTTDTEVEMVSTAGVDAAFQLTVGGDGVRTLTWGGARSADAGQRGRTLTLPATAHFEENADGVIRLWLSPGTPPLLVVDPRRQAAFDCRYDVVARRCR